MPQYVPFVYHLEYPMEESTLQNTLQINDAYRENQEEPKIWKVPS